MEYLNIQIATLRSPEFVGSDPVQRATWLCLNSYCAAVENHGRIPGCRAWGDRKWGQICGVTAAEVTAASDLWQWDGDDLIVAFYPLDSEEIVTAKRARARENGKRGGRPKTDIGTNIETNIETNIGLEKKPTLEPISEPILKPISESVKERKEKEGKGIGERERADAPAVAGAPPSPITAETIVGSYPRRERFADALTHVSGQIRRGEIDPAAALAGTRSAAAFLATVPGGHLNRYVPHALSFFLSLRWQDDPQTLIRPPESKSNSKPTLSDSDIAAALGGRLPTDPTSPPPSIP